MTWTIRILAIEAALTACALTVALDLREHGRVAPLGGVNEWGYRGTIARHREPGEIRIAVVGGTRAFGWGLAATALVAELRRVIMLTTDRPGKALRPVVAINLGRLGALPDAYPEVLDHFGYLAPDYVCLYDDLGVPGGSPTPGTDGTSGVYELTGYAPALPLVESEKGAILRRRSGVTRAGGAMLEAAGDTLQALDRKAAAIVSLSPAPAPLDPSRYADAMMASIDAAHRRARGVVVVLSPAETAMQRANRAALGVRLGDAAAVNGSWLRVVDLSGDPALSGDPDIRLDGWNYASAGVARVANVIAPALLELIPS